MKLEKLSKLAQLSKKLRDDAPLTVQQFGHNIVSPKFPVPHCLSLTCACWKI